MAEKDRMKRMVATVVSAACATFGIAALPALAGASIVRGSSEFCNVLSDGNQLVERLDEDSASEGIASIKRLLKTDVPKKVSKALKKIKKGYQRVADGDWNAADFLRRVAKPLATYSVYVAENCDLD